MSDGGTTITWWGHACVEVRTPGGKTILFDPWFGNPSSPKAAADVERCDVMLVTHGHHDHLGAAPGGVRDADALTISRRTKPAWPCIHELSLWLGDRLAGAGVDVIGCNIGGTVEVAGLKVSLVPAVHSAGDWSAEGEGPLYLGSPAGMVVELEDGSRLYHAGDTNAFGDMRLIGELHRPDLAMLPIGGHYTMGPREAALAVELLGVREVLPIHYGTFPVLVGRPSELLDELVARGLREIVVHDIQPGESISR